MAESHFTGPGEVILAPDIWGDIVPIYLDGRVPWKVGKHSYLACTQGVIKTHKSQGVMKGLCQLIILPGPLNFTYKGPRNSFSLRRRRLRARSLRAGDNFRPVHGRDCPETLTRRRAVDRRQWPPRRVVCKLQGRAHSGARWLPVKDAYR